MGPYKVYIDQGLDLCPKIYLQEEPKSRTQHADHTEPPDDVSAHITYERTASSSNPTHTSQDTESARDYIASSSIAAHASQDTRFALATPSSNITHASQDIQSNPDIFSVSSTNQTRPSQDTQLARSTPPKYSIHASQGDLTTSPNNRNPSNHPSNPLPSHRSHLPEPQSSQTHRSKSKDSEPSPLPTLLQTLDPCPPCAKRLWSTVTRAPPPEPPGPRTRGLWTKTLCSSTTPPPAPAPGAIKLEPPRRYGLFLRRLRSSVRLLDLPPPADLQPRGNAEERRMTSPIIVNVRSETWPSSSRQRSHDPLSPHHPDPELPTTTTPFSQRRTRSSSQNDQTSIYVPPIQKPPPPSSVYSTSHSTPYPPNPLHHEDTPSLPTLQHHLNYTFRDPSLLSEALTPPTPGHSNNARLSYLGRRAMELVLWESCYALRLSERVAREAVARAFGVEALVGTGMRCGLGGFVGGGERVLAMEVRRGVLAVVGGVYLDGGVGEVRRVIEGLGSGLRRGRRGGSGLVEWGENLSV